MDEIVPGVRVVEHTADEGIEVEGATLATLFRRAAAGTLALFRTGVPGEDPGAHPAEVIEVELRAADLTSLLVQWLREVLFVAGTRELEPGEVEIEQVGDGVLRARLHCRRVGPGAFREVKGVTYHGLEVRRDGGWHARVIFDV